MEPVDTEGIDLLQKPFTLMDIAERVREVLEARTGLSIEPFSAIEAHESDKQGIV